MNAVTPAAASVTARAEHRSFLVSWVLAYLRANGIDTAALVARFGLLAAEASDDGIVLSIDRLEAFTDAAARVAGDPALGVHVAEWLPVGSHGLLEYCWRNAPTAGAALAYAAKHFAVFRNASGTFFETTRAGARFFRRVDGAPRGMGRHANEFFVTTTLLQMRELTRTPFVPVRAFFAHARPSDVSELVRVVGTANLVFGAGDSGIDLEHALVAAPIPTADGALLAMLGRYVHERLGLDLPGANGDDAAPELLDLVRQAVRVRLPHGEPELAALAAACRTSPRTLQRRLGAAGTSLKRVIDEVRSELSRAALEHEDVAVAELAERLGYDDAKSFLRAFKRWTGTSPGRFRERVRNRLELPHAPTRGA
jgi:AraC-like DNA-binding protein